MTLPLICTICKEEFHVKPYRFAAKFCSSKCFGKSRIGKVPTSAWKKGQIVSPETQFKKGKKHVNWGKTSGALGKHWKLSDETHKKMSKAQQGRRHPWQADELHHNWKGDDVGKVALHDWVKRRLGRPDTCEHCGRSGLSRNGIDWANKSHQYKREISDWIRLCRKCHKKYDRKLPLDITC